MTYSIADRVVSSPRTARSGAADRSAGDARWVPFLVFLLPMGVALACVLPGIGHRQLWRDEHDTWWASSIRYADLGLLIQHVDVVVAPFYALMHAWTALAGTSPAALRLPQGLAMAVSAGLLGLLGRQLFTSRTGLVAGLLFALVPTVTRYGHEARPYAFAVLFSLLATLLLLRALQRPTLKGWALYTSAITLTGLSHLVALCVVAVHAVAVLRARRGGDHVAHWAFGCAAVMGTSAVVPMIAKGSEQAGRIAWHNATVRDLTTYPMELFGTWFSGAVLMGLGVVGLLTAGRKAVVVPAVWAVLPPVLAFLTYDLFHLFQPRYLLFTVPAWLLLAAAGAVRCADALTLAGRTGRLRRVAGGVLVTGAVAGFAFQVLPALATARQDLPGEPDFAAAGRIVTVGQRPGDGIVYNGDFGVRKAMAYELRESARPKDVLMKLTPQQTGWYAADECDVPADCLVGRRRLWLVSTAAGSTRSGMSASTGAALAGRFTVVHTKRLHNLTVQLLERRNR
ncbi:glycosyltransferase family 39 protein [Streptomyces phaeochromogenes]|uniref:glycosyltransferase family 39 protein n=1 Tax=Streptomyces phaeochromogenes TaxID=1923 RepID=UPI002DDAFEFA|nr:glycosyltransferase family 39 protein [Streptomyces phaeochromogenes]WRZ35612.1 glycosyltransferase family 39 protein [Streptomyces phaeochromogenes]